MAADIQCTGGVAKLRDQRAVRTEHGPAGSERGSVTAHADYARPERRTGGITQRGNSSVQEVVMESNRIRESVNMETVRRDLHRGRDDLRRELGRRDWQGVGSDVRNRIHDGSLAVHRIEQNEIV